MTTLLLRSLESIQGIDHLLDSQFSSQSCDRWAIILLSEFLAVRDWKEQFSFSHPIPFNCQTTRRHSFSRNDDRHLSHLSSYLSWLTCHFLENGWDAYMGFGKVNISGDLKERKRMKWWRDGSGHNFLIMIHFIELWPTTYLLDIFSINPLHEKPFFDCPFNQLQVHDLRLKYLSDSDIFCRLVFVFLKEGFFHFNATGMERVQLKRKNPFYWI